MIAIGALSKQTGVNIETIRYYERIGVLPSPSRTAAGRRVYGAGEVRRLSFIRHARDLGFSLSVIREMIALQERPDMPCCEVTRLATGQLDAVEHRVARLLLLRSELQRMIASCASDRMADCRIIEALAETPPSL